MRAWWSNSPSIERAQVIKAGLIGSVLSLIQFYTLLSGLGSRIAADDGDPVSQSWQVAWGGHALLHHPLAFWQANQFWPAKDSLAFSDALVGYAPFGLLGSGVDAALTRYNLLFLFAFALAFFAVWLLARELGAPNWAAMVGGAAFAYSPWRLEQAGHLHVISSGGIALAIFLLLRGYRRNDWRLITGGWVAAAWQQSIGFTLGLQLDYLLLLLGLIGLITWLRAGRPHPPATSIKATAVGVGFFLLSTWLLTRPYLRVLNAEGRTSYSLQSLYSFSPSLRSFLSPPEYGMLFSKTPQQLTAAVGKGYAEKVLYPGLITALLAIIGLWWKGIPKALRVGLGLTTVLFAVLSLGVHQTGVGHYLPYRFVFEYLPGWDGIRTPGRLHTLTTLALALLAAAGAARVGELIRQRKRSSFATAGVVVLGLLVLADGSGIPFPNPAIRKAPADVTSLATPLIHTPLAPSDNRLYLLWSTESFQPMINGRSTFIPSSYYEAETQMATFPSAESIGWLRRHGVKTVIVHTEFTEQRSGERFKGKFHTEPQFRSPTWAQATAAKIPAGSRVTRELVHPVVIYHLAP
ncbi:MAG: hypothetical protein NTY57_08290 [Solirubrobacterales bacterium]|nr:hypothetical protein [Solirubrobacterales bacterium]